VNFSPGVRFFRRVGRYSAGIHLLCLGLMVFFETIQHQGIPGLEIPQENPADPLYSGTRGKVSRLLAKKMRDTV